MRGESMKDKSKKSTYSTTFGVDPKSTYSTTFGVDPIFGVDPKKRPPLCEAVKMVAGPGIEPGTQGFSVLRSTN